MFSLFKVAAEGRAAARSNIVENRTRLSGALRGRMFTLLGHDPGLPDDAVISQFVSRLDDCVPHDVGDKQAGMAYYLAREFLLSSLKAGADGGYTWAESDAAREFAHYVNVFEELAAKSSGPLRDFSRIKSFDELRQVVSELEKADRAREEDSGPDGGAKYVRSIAGRAADGSTHLAGEPGDPLALAQRSKGKSSDDSQEEDLVNGALAREEWHIVVPNNKESAIYWGAGTDWCTAKRGSGEVGYHKYHKPEDPLVIFTNSRTGHRYQFHYSSRQFRDIHENEIKNLALAKGLHDFVEHLGVDHPLRGRSFFDISGRQSLDATLETEAHGSGGTDENPEELRAQQDSLKAAARKSGNTRGGLVSSKSIDGKAIPIRVNDKLLWVKDGVMHRVDGPAIIGPNKVEYYRDGKRQVSYGPSAVSFGDGWCTAQWNSKEDTSSYETPLKSAGYRGNEVFIECFPYDPIVNSGEDGGRFIAIEGVLPNGPFKAKPENPANYPADSLDEKGMIDPENHGNWSNGNRCKQELYSAKERLERLAEEHAGEAEDELAYWNKYLDKQANSKFRLTIKRGQ
jgi:hypothetical protein